jgi:hypothetical protein
LGIAACGFVRIARTVDSKLQDESGKNTAVKNIAVKNIAVKNIAVKNIAVQKHDIDNNTEHNC